MLRIRVPEVIPVRRKAYRAAVVNRVNEAVLTKGREGAPLVTALSGSAPP